jgi:nucleotide-binding universal stress UspA family protein
VTSAVEPAAGPGLIVGYKGEAGSDVLVFAKRWVRASGENVQVVTVYPGPAPIGPGRVDAEWVAYGREEADRLLAAAKAELADSVPASFRSIGADSASHALHDLVEADPETVVVLGSRKTRGLRRTSPGSTAERLLQGSTGPVALVPWDYETTEDNDLARVAVAYVDTPDGHAALTQAISLTQRLGASLTVLTVVPDTRVVPSFGDVRRFGEEQRRGYQDALDQALGTVPADL